MAVFTLSDNMTYINDYSKFESNGFPIMFMDKNKHIYFCSPDVNNKSYDFSCAELSVKNNVNTYKGDIFINSGQPVKKFVSGISVDDHKITCTYNSVTLPTATNGLKYSRLYNTIGHFNELPAGNISALGTVSYLMSGLEFDNCGFEYDNNGHITDNYTNKVFMPKSEISLSKTKNSYTTINSSYENPYIQFIEKGGSTTTTTSVLQIKGGTLLNAHGDSNNTITLDVKENITTTYSYNFPSVYYIPNSSLNGRSSYQTVYNDIYYNSYTKTTSLPELIFTFEPSNDVVNYKISLLFVSNSNSITIYYNGHSQVLSLADGSVTVDLDISSNEKLDILIVRKDTTYPVNCYARVSYINDMELTSTDPAFDFGCLYSLYKPGTNVQNTHGGNFFIYDHLPNPSLRNTCNSVIATTTNNESNSNEIYLSSYHYTRSTYNEFSYIAKQIKYDMFGHITDIIKTDAGIQNIISCSQSYYNASSKDSYTLYIITS